MKNIILIVSMYTCMFFSPSVYADFFSEEILDANPEVVMIQDIQLNSITFVDSKEMKRYNNTVYFVSSIKTEAMKRFQDGTIPLYRRYDIITTLDSFVYTMNQYFLYQKKYEQTQKSVFKESARSYLEDSR